MLNREDITSEKVKEFAELRCEIMEQLANDGTWSVSKLVSLSLLAEGRTKRVLKSARMKERSHETAWELLQILALDEQEVRATLGNIFKNGFV